ncbi:hypothetical protein LOK49_LG10G02142 [Camellia lanceoleosa]|uniref:Uncharacterized protein n=1 Tax=Camellia lanceoleosa TaxID=1840588 RepID=A0ACC0GBG6_9ERIC|nr:hypothetical protein LOK49_LG10G02142 [Camellia lanceoleosa]
MSIQMASSTSSATSSWPPRMCASGFGHCVVKISRSAKNPGHAFYVCPRTMDQATRARGSDGAGVLSAKK